MKIYNKFFSLLNTKQKKSIIFLGFLIILGTLFEMLGVGLVVPTMAIFLENNFTFRIPLINDLMENLSLYDFDREKLLYLLVSIIFTVFLMKAFILTFIHYYTLKLMNKIELFWSNTIYSGYLNENYNFHTKKNSATLIRNILNCSPAVSALKDLVTFVTEILVMIGVVSLLIIIEPIGACLVFLILFLSSVLFYSFIRKRLYNWGNTRMHHDGYALQQMQQGFGAIKAVKILGLENFFAKKFFYHKLVTTQMNVKREITRVIPIIWLELLIVISLITLLTYLIYLGESKEFIITLLGLFVVAAFRLLPSTNRILNSIQGMRYSSPHIDVIHAESVQFKKHKKIERKKIEFKFKNKIELKNVCFAYPDRDGAKIDNINISIGSGESIGIFGSTGSGKSTLIDLILGLQQPENGQITVDGKDIHSNLNGWQQNIGYVPQQIVLNDDTIKNNIAFGIEPNLIDEKAIYSCIKQAKLEDFIKGLPEGINTLVGERGARLSGGQLQRIGIARSLYHNPSLIIFDEATSSLDISTESSIMDTVGSFKNLKTIIIISHRLNSLSFCDKLYKIEKGRIIDAGNYERMIKNNYYV